MLGVASRPLVVISEFARVDETDHEWLPALALSAIQQLEHEALTAPSAMDEHVFESDQLREMRPYLEVTPTGCLADVAAGEAILLLMHAESRARGIDQPHEEAEELASLRRELVERAAEHFVRELIRQLDVGERDFDVLDHFAARKKFPLLRSLVLMQKRDRANEREVLHVIAARPRP